MRKVLKGQRHLYLSEASLNFSCFVHFDCVNVNTVEIPLSELMKLSQCFEEEYNCMNIAHWKCIILRCCR